MVHVCRTCTQQISTSEYFYLDGSTCGSSTLLLKDMIKTCIPEFNTNLTPNPVICRNCLSTLCIAYHFKSEALKNEETFQRLSTIKKERIDNLCIVEVVTETGEPYEGNVFTDPPDLNNTHLSGGQAQSTESSYIHKYIKVKNTESADQIPVLECPPLVPFDDRLHLQESLVLSDNSKATKETRTPSQYCVKLGEKCHNVSTRNVVEDNVSPDNELNMEYTIQYEKKTYQCKHCGFKADTRIVLNKHGQLHTEDKPFHCTLCPYKAKQKAHLEGHMKVHTGERPYLCSVCGSAFKMKGALDKHKLLHLEDKLFKCQECCFRCKQRSTLVGHIRRVHMGIISVLKQQASVCHICGKKLSGPSALHAHMNIHSGVKSHQCSYCGKCFRERAILKNHLAIHTGEKPFKCKNCDYSSSRRAYLLMHMKAFGNHPNLVDCHLCGKLIACRSLLQRHLNSAHRHQIGVGSREKATTEADYQEEIEIPEQLEQKIFVYVEEDDEEEQGP